MEFKRAVAFKVKISEIINGKYVKTEGFFPNYIEFNGKEFSKVNIIGTVILKQENEYKSMTIDDGSGAIQLRFFEENPAFGRMMVGDAVIVIGKPREYMSSKYILPEILKKVNDNRLIKLRQIELKLNKDNEKYNAKSEVVEIEQIEADVESYKEVIDAVKELDLGEGADFESVLDKLSSNYNEESIKKLIEKGELFEIKPGRLKVL